MARAKYKPDFTGTRGLAASPLMGQGMAKIAKEKGKPAAESAAPVVSGAYKSSFYVEKQMVPGGGKRGETRAGAVLVNKQPYAVKVERKYGALRQAKAAMTRGGR